MKWQPLERPHPAVAARNFNARISISKTGLVHQTIEHTACRRVNWEGHLICGCRSGDVYPICSKSRARWVRLHLQQPASVIVRPGQREVVRRHLGHYIGGHGWQRPRPKYGDLRISAITVFRGRVAKVKLHSRHIGGQRT